MPKTKEEKSAYDQALVKKLYRRVSLYLPKDWSADLDRITKARSLSLNGYIQLAIAAKMAEDVQRIKDENTPENTD